MVMPWQRTATLRERQAEAVRISVLQAVIAQLETRAFDDISMTEVAEAAGISLRTLYRYFPDRDALLHAAGEHLYASLDIPFEVDRPEQISTSFREAAGKLSQRPELTRALVRSSAGRSARSAVRARRVEAIKAALAPAATGVDARDGSPGCCGDRPPVRRGVVGGDRRRAGPARRARRSAPSRGRSTASSPHCSSAAPRRTRGRSTG